MVENGRREKKTGFELAFSRVNSSSNKHVQKILLEEFPHKYVQYVLNSSIDFQSFSWIVKTSKGKIPVRATNYFPSSFCRVATKATKKVKLPSCRTFYSDMNIIQII